MEVEEVPVETNNSVAVPELLSYVNYNQYTCGTKWSSNGETCAVSSETSVNIYSYYQNSLSYRASIKHAECLYDWQMVGAEDWVGVLAPPILAFAIIRSAGTLCTFILKNHTDNSKMH